jgi:hypothetical protein
MAIISQGVELRRASTYVLSDTTVGLAITATAICRTDAGDFTVDGISTGMRIYIGGSSSNLNVYTVSAVAATVITPYETMSEETSTALYITGRSFSRVSEVTGFSAMTGSAAVIDVSNFQDSAKNKMVGLRDEGQATFELNLLPTQSTGVQHLDLIEDRQTRTLRYWDLKLTDQSTGVDPQPSALNFKGYITGFVINGGVDNKISASMTIEIDGPVKFIDRV